MIETPGHSNAALMETVVWRALPHTHAHRLSGGRWRQFSYLVMISRLIADAVRRGGGRLIVNLPPRHGKSELLSFRVPLWFLDAFPERRVMLCSYEAGVAADWGRKVRDEMAANRLCLTRLREDSKSAARWNTPEGGGMVTAGVGGPIAGRGGDLILVDDPHKNWQEAYSPLARRRIVEWFRSTLYTRAEPGATIVVLMNRWHVADLAGYLTKHHEDEWMVVKLPALAQQNDPLGREPGEAMCPERFPASALRSIQAAVGSAVWSALYQQEPAVSGEGLVYDAFDRFQNVRACAYHPDRPIIVGSDFNRTPMAWVLGHHYADRRAFEWFDELWLENATTRRTLDELHRRYGDHRGGFEFYGDATGRAHRTNAEESDYDLICVDPRFRTLGRAVYYSKAPPSVADRYAAMNALFCSASGERRQFVDPRCRHLIEDLEEFRYAPDGREGDKDSDPTRSHASDAAGYAVYWHYPVWVDMRPMAGIEARFNV